MKLIAFNKVFRDEATFAHEETAAAFRRGRKERSAAAVARGVRAERAARRKERDARHRADVHNGIRSAYVRYDDRMLSFLIATKWLREDEANDRRKIGDAIARLIRDAMRR